MSCPWWDVKVWFEDGTQEDFQAEGCTRTEAITNLFDHPHSVGDVLADAVTEHGDVLSVQVARDYLEPEPFDSAESGVVEVQDVL